MDELVTAEDLMYTWCVRRALDRGIRVNPFHSKKVNRVDCGTRHRSSSASD